jgi:hypothetical protein
MEPACAPGGIARKQSVKPAIAKAAIAVFMRTPQSRTQLFIFFPFGILPADGNLLGDSATLHNL